jgi:hypothetical protein
MRKALPILLVAGLISILAEAVSGPVPTSAKSTPKLVTNGVQINGLHVALPVHMKSFPAELVPLP